MRSQTRVEIGGRALTLTNLAKPMYPKAGFTKAHVIDYYRRIAPALLPHLRDRALTMNRYPDGVEGESFYEKSCPEHRPDWIRTAGVWSASRGEDIRFCVLDDLPSLVWVANLADLELHTYLAKVQDPLRPTTMVFDLDPGPGTSIVDCAEVAIVLRDILAELGLESFPKTSGSKGMQLYVPINAPATFEETKGFARTLGGMIERERPEAVTTNMRKAEREGRVFIDWSQNDDHKTTICAYSLRAREEPTVSTPLAWREVDALLASGDAALARFLPGEVVDRVAKHGDLFAPVLSLEQPLPPLV